MPARLCSKSFKLGFSSMWIENFQMFKLDLQKAEEPEIKLPTYARPSKKQGNLKKKKKINFCFTDYAKVFDCVDHNKLQNILKEMGIPDHLSCLLRNLYANQEQTVRTLHGMTDLFKTGKGVWQGCTLSPVYLTYMQSTSCKMPRRINHQQDQDIQEKYKRLQICRWYHSNGRK